MQGFLKKVVGTFAVVGIIVIVVIVAPLVFDLLTTTEIKEMSLRIILILSAVAFSGLFVAYLVGLAKRSFS